MPAFDESWTCNVPALEVLETERLILRPLEVGDAVVHGQLWTERDPRVEPDVVRGNSFLTVRGLRSH